MATNSKASFWFNQPIYANEHTEQLCLLFKKGYPDQVAMANPNNEDEILSQTGLNFAFDKKKPGFSKKGKRCCNKFYFPALLSNKLYHQLIQELQSTGITSETSDPNSNLTALQMCYKTMAYAMINSGNVDDGKYLQSKAYLREKHGEKWVDIVNNWVQEQQAKQNQQSRKQHNNATEVPLPMVPLPVTKSALRQCFEALCSKATRSGYFETKKVPAYLISGRWLQMLYTEAEEKSQDDLSEVAFCTSPIDNRHLCRLNKFIDSSSPEYSHYNYTIREQCKENVDFKIVSEECWRTLNQMLLGESERNCDDKVAGIEVKRYTTNEDNPTVELRYRKINVKVVQNRFFYTFYEEGGSLVQDEALKGSGVELYVSRFETFHNIIKRIKRICTAYKLVPFEKITTNPLSLIKVNRSLTDAELIDDVQNPQQLCSDSQNYQRINLDFNPEEAEIFHSQKGQTIILNIHSSHRSQRQMSASKTTSSNQEKQSSFSFESTEIFGKTIDMVKRQSQSSSQANIEAKQSTKNAKQESKSDQVDQQITSSTKVAKSEETPITKSSSSVSNSKLTQQVKRLIDKYDVRSQIVSLSEQQIKQWGKTGLENLGNTCYFNSALQCLLRVSKLVRYFSANEYLKDLNPENVLGSQGYLACAFGELIKKYYITKKRSIEPTDVLRIVAKNPQFRGMEHQDSQEFLNYFLDKLHEDLNRIKKKPYTEEIESNGRPDEVVSKESWQNYLKRNQSHIQELFTGQYRSEIRCPDCEKISITFDPFMSVTLQFPKEEKLEEVKGYILGLDGQYQKVCLKIPRKTSTKLFYDQVFHAEVVGANIKSRKLKKLWRPDVSVVKNIPEDGILLFYQKQQKWTQVFDLHFVDEKGEMMAFNRRVYTHGINSIGDLEDCILRRNITPLKKALENRDQFKTQGDFVEYCKNHKLINFLEKDQIEIEKLKALEAEQNDPQSSSSKKECPVVIKVSLNSTSEHIKFKNPPKFNFSSSDYTVKRQLAAASQGSKDSFSVAELLENFKTPEQLSEDNMWYCNKCKDHKMAQKMMRIYKLPEVLIMHLKRFNHKSTRFRNLIGVEKIDKAISLKEVETIGEKQVQYELTGVVNHFGSMNFGHYTAYVKKDEWCYYDDSSVRKGQFKGDNAYLLFYQRKQKSSESSEK